MKKIALILSLSLLATITSCVKYDEGSNFSLISAKARLVNEWVIEDYQVNNVSQTLPNGASLEVEFEKDGDFTRTWVYGQFRVDEDGKWAFSSDKKNVILNLENGNLETYYIIQLKNNALKARSTDANGNELLYIFKGK